MKKVCIHCIEDLTHMPFLSGSFSFYHRLQYKSQMSLSFMFQATYWKGFAACKAEKDKSHRGLVLVGQHMYGIDTLRQQQMPKAHDYSLENSISVAL